MCNAARPLVDKQHFREMLDLLEPDARALLMEYLKANDWTDEFKRLRDLAWVGIGTHRLLIGMTIEHFDGSPEALVAFYDKWSRPEDEPHYEDLINSILLPILISVLANYVFWRGITPRAKREEATKDLMDRLWKSYGKVLNYLPRAKSLRVDLAENLLSRQEHDAILINLKARWLGLTAEVRTKISDEKVRQIEARFQVFVQRHGLTIDDPGRSLFETLVRFSLDRCEGVCKFEAELRSILKSKEKANGAR